ncbi:MAG: hypothetical protein AAF483_21810 [Planctomycetota bacterium]
MGLLFEFEYRYRDYLGKSLKSTFGDLDKHEGILLNTPKEVNAFFEDMMDANRMSKFNVEE